MSNVNEAVWLSDFCTGSIKDSYQRRYRFTFWKIVILELNLTQYTIHSTTVPRFVAKNHVRSFEVYQNVFFLFCFFFCCLICNNHTNVSFCSYLSSTGEKSWTMKWCCGYTILYNTTFTEPQSSLRNLSFILNKRRNDIPDLQFDHTCSSKTEMAAWRLWQRWL